MLHLARKVALNTLNGYKYTITLSTSAGVLVGAYEGLKIANKETFRDGGINLGSGVSLLFMFTIGHGMYGCMYGICLPIIVPNAVYEKIKSPDGDFSSYLSPSYIWGKLIIRRKWKS